MKPMHKQGVRPDKTSKLRKRLHRWDCEDLVPDDKGAHRAERRKIEREALRTQPSDGEGAADDLR